MKLDGRPLQRGQRRRQDDGDGCRGVNVDVAEGRDHRVAEDAVLAFVDRRQRVHHHEEGEQQSNEICIRNEPALVVIVLFLAFSPGHDQTM